MESIQILPAPTVEQNLRPALCPECHKPKFFFFTAGASALSDREWPAYDPTGNRHIKCPQTLRIYARHSFQRLA